MSVLTKLADREKWRKMKKLNGKVLQKKLTQKGNVKLVVMTGKGEQALYILKRNKNLFEITNSIEKGEAISVAVRRYLGKYYCTKVDIAQKESSETLQKSFGILKCRWNASAQQIKDEARKEFY